MYDFLDSRTQSYREHIIMAAVEHQNALLGDPGVFVANSEGHILRK
jgi:hypothetical protein